jgi:hypothetical protein
MTHVAQNPIDQQALARTAKRLFSSYGLMRRPITDIALWFTKNSVSALPNWTFVDYFLLTLFSSSVVLSFLNLIMTDAERETAWPKDLTHYILSPLTIAISLGILVITEQVLFMLLSTRLESILWTAIITRCFLSQRGVSGSAIARNFILHTVKTGVGLAIFHATGSGTVVLCIVLAFLVDLIRRMIILLSPGASILDEAVNQMISMQKR